MEEIFKKVYPEFLITKDNDITVIGIIKIDKEEEENINKSLKIKKFSINYENEILSLKTTGSIYYFDTTGFEEGFGQKLFKNDKDFDICFMFCVQVNDFIVPKNEENFVVNVKI